VRRTIRHDPAVRVLAGSFRALGIPAGRGGLAALEWRIRGGGSDSLRLPAFTQPPLRRRGGRDLRRPRMDLPRTGPER